MQRVTESCYTFTICILLAAGNSVHAGALWRALPEVPQSQVPRVWHRHSDFLQVVKSFKRNFHIYENILEIHRLEKGILSLSLHVVCVCVYVYIYPYPYMFVAHFMYWV